ncbi:MAG: hypothetical protein ACE15D_17015 [Candidatus Eisenbacteria bacterium]
MCLSRWRITGIVAAGLLLLSALTVRAGKNADGALIVHTDNTVTYTATGDYCGVDLRMPGSCEDAVARSNKNSKTPAVIWILAAFPEESDPAVAGIQFGVEHNLPQGQEGVVAYQACGESPLELPDDGFPGTPGGTLVAYGEPVSGSTLFPVCWVAAYGSLGDSLRTAEYPGSGHSYFADDSVPAVEDEITNFGILRWQSDGMNDCPGGPSLDGAEWQDDPQGTGTTGTIKAVTE